MTRTPTRLADLVGGLPVAGAFSPTLSIAGVAHDSRRVEPGDLFVAWAGEKHDGRSFAADAQARGAVAVLADGPAPSGVTLPWITAAEPRRLLAPIAARLYRHPDRELVLAGVTGTNGKSTTIALLRDILDAAGRPCGLIGTLGYEFAGKSFGGGRTTPEASDFYATLRSMRDAGAAAVASEVSSHALAQGRVAGVAFDLAIFTNLTRDHFDLHGDFAAYFAAKRKLFAQLKPGGAAVVNAEDEYGARLARELPRALTYGEGGAVRAASAELDADGIRGVITTPRGEFPFVSPLLGRYNLSNLLAAAAGAEALGLAHEAIARGIATRGPIDGRLEPVRAGQEFPVVVDYAHTDAALVAALTSLRELARRKVVVVFGCGGDRDPGKRPLMGEAAGRLADLPIATSDNPRSEDPQAILRAVEEGLKKSGNAAYRIVPDRREAIRRAVAVAAAAPGEWAVLVAGKGHEAEQIVGAQRLPFSDREELAKALEERRGPAARG
jgi:UDP-N-acetylmuramoyl-L-alanyl-D-glutamate--2,6-diaminopimelate ligase